VPLADCPIAHPRVNELGVPRRSWPGCAAVEVVAPTDGQDRLVVLEPARPGERVEAPPLAAEASLAMVGSRPGERLRRVRGRTWVSETVLVDGTRRTFRLTGSGFWQVHPGAAQALVDAVLEAAEPRPGERALDLYSGVGLFCAGLAARVGGFGKVLAVESDPAAVADARRSLHDVPQVQLETGRVERVLGELVGPGTAWPRLDVVVADPPRSGLGAAVAGRLAALAPRVLVLVACDPAAMARDVAALRGGGYELAGLRAFDAFPMTHHVECVAVLRRVLAGGALR